MLSTKQHYVLKYMGVLPLVLNQNKKKEAHSKTDESDLIALEKRVKACQACALHQHRTQAVFGVGHQQPAIMIVGEAPGKNEDLQGEPFVGRAGQLLNRMLKSIGFERKDVYITNVLKCRPPQNRDPLPSEVSSCTPFLDQQVNHLKPKIILALGRYAAHYLLNTTSSLGKLRHTIHTYGESHTPLIVSYHPAYLLRNPRDKAKAYEDLCELLQQLKNT